MNVEGREGDAGVVAVDVFVGVGGEAFELAEEGEEFIDVVAGGGERVSGLLDEEGKVGVV